MYKFITIVLLTTILFGCKQNYTPKPRGYFRIDLPEKEYRTTPNELLYSFEYSKYSFLQEHSNSPKKHYWINIVYPKLNAKVHLSYKPVENSINAYTEDAREFVYKHTIKADAISETPYVNIEKKVYGLMYEIKGDAASNSQFYITDSVNHFLRGALYFNAVPNKDSLAPVINYINADIKHIIETFNWK